MKKFAIGCGIALLLTGMAAAGVAYYVYRQVSSTFTQFAELGKVPEIERDVRNQQRFEPPVSAELTEGQIAKLLQVQTTVRQRLGERMNTFTAKYKDLTEKEEASVTDAPQILKAYADLAVAWLEAKRTQVEALNAVGLSLDEYRWIRDQAYRALGMPFIDFDLGRLAEDAKRGVSSPGAGRLRGAIGPAGPESNRALVAPMKQQLTDNIALASFGL